MTVQELSDSVVIAYLDDRERLELFAAVQFREMAELRPGSCWGKARGSMDECDEDEELQTSGELMAESERTIERLIGVAFRRRALQGLN